MIIMVVEIFDQELKDFINSLDRDTSSKTLRTIDLLGRFENQLRMPYSKALGKGLYELRIRGQKEIRIFYTFHHGEAVLLHGFVKKQQKTPQKELKIAFEKLNKLIK